MKFAGIVLRNKKNPFSSVAYEPVHDALLSGGVFLDEIVFLAYDAPSELLQTLARLTLECKGVFLVCDDVLVPTAKTAVCSAAGGEYGEGALFETEECLFAVLPDGGRGAELVAREVIPAIDRRRNNSYARVVVCAVSVPAEKLENALTLAREAAQGKLGFHASEKYGALRIELIYDRETPKMIADEVVRILASELTEYVYAVEDVTIAERLVEALKLHRLRLSTAESFTGGGIGREIVRVPGASAVFYEGLNTYDNGSKTDRLGVSAYTLKSKGAVSDDTAYEMAAGLLAQGKCDVAVATTGVAGPDPMSADKPAGLCYIAVGTKEKVRVFRFRLSGDRETVTQTAINLALFLTYQEIK